MNHILSTSARMSSGRRLALVGLGSMALGLTALLMLAPDAQALKITLKRAVFEGPSKAQTLTIINNSPEDQTYRLGWRTMRMTENQSLVPVDDPAQATDLKPAEDMIRYSPRRITIPAGGTQQVRLLLRKPKELAEGEYRSHFWIQPEAESVKFDPLPPDKAEDAKTKPMVQIKMLTGMTIPVIVRHGKLAVAGSITDLKVSPDKDGKGMNVGFTLNRDGNRSLYGDLTFSCGGATVKQVKGIAVYTEISKRFLNFSVPYPEGGASACSSLKVEYVADQDDFELKGQSISAAETSVQ